MPKLQATRDPSQTETLKFVAEPGKRPVSTTASINWPSNSFAIRSLRDGLRATRPGSSSISLPRPQYRWAGHRPEVRPRALSSSPPLRQGLSSLFPSSRFALNIARLLRYHTPPPFQGTKACKYPGAMPPPTMRSLVWACC